DIHTLWFVCEYLLHGHSLANCTVILVTRHVELILPGAYYLVCMLDDRIDAHGIVKDLRV
ncbi:hypothetical protein P691DRAFT_671517, partial [Macrolepiota fuliginosa MF-IS2]